MKTLELIAYKRKKLGKKESKRLRAEGNLPSVMYGKEKVYHFYVPMRLFQNLIYTTNVYLINMNIEGKIHQCILQDFQVHPVSEILIHADFFEIKEDKSIKMNIPIKYTGISPGAQKGGKLVQKLRYINVKALPSKIPDFINVNIDNLEMGESIKIESLLQDDYTILNNKNVPVASIEIPRALRSAKSKEE